MPIVGANFRGMPASYGKKSLRTCLEKILQDVDGVIP